MALGHKTKTKIGLCYLQLCEEKQSSKVSVREVATKAEINRQTFYYHFKDIDTLLHWIYCNDALRFLIEEQVTLSNWEEQVLKLLKAIYNKRDFYQMMLLENRESVIHAFFPTIENVFRQLFLQVDEEKKLSEKDHQFYSRFFSFGCCGILETWIREDYVEQPVEIAAQLFQLAKDIELFSYRIFQRIENEQGGLS